MDRHRCKLCLKSFANGRALGGHMRSHMVNLYVPPKESQQLIQLGEDTESASSSSSSDSEEEEEKEEKELLCYGLRENPKKSIRLVDPEFSFAGSGSVVVQDRESETESSKNPIRRRSKRIRKSGFSDHHHHLLLHHHHQKKPKFGKSEPTWVAEPEPVSSISDTTPEEDVAYCLMMLSRDNWMREKQEEEEEEDEEEEEEEEEEYVELKKQTKTRGKYKCETCFKVFRSYQALGGHRASHKKNRLINTNTITNSTQQLETETRNVGGSCQEKIHECPVCYRVFSSGQALGGHKRSHVIGSSSSATLIAIPKKPPPTLKSGDQTTTTTTTTTLIDLNLPAPIDDDEISQIELSAVSDAEFFNPHQGMNN